ncbi:hypothetical protein QL093DRAFT_2301978 [Fusarium oxysporum]|nr:hypothetical protein QL093DRAFT_2301978 [Fusarium oxysporum]
MFTHIMVIHLCLSLCFCYPVIASILFPLIISNPSVNHCSQIKTIDVSLCSKKAMSCRRQEFKQKPLYANMSLSCILFSPLFFLVFVNTFPSPIFFFFHFLGCSAVCLLSPSSCRCFSLPPLQSKAAFFFSLIAKSST